MGLGRFLKIRFTQSPKEEYLGATLNMSPYWAFNVINKALNKNPPETKLTLPNIGMTLTIAKSSPQLHFVHFGFHNNYTEFALELDKINTPDHLRPFHCRMPDTGGVTRNYAFDDFEGNLHMMWAIICGKSQSEIFDEYILAHEEGHVAMIGLRLHEDKNHQKAMFLATTGRANPS